MAQPRVATDGVNQSKGAGHDPLASPTLAALYASQGHVDVAEMIYAQLGRRPEGAGAASTGGAVPAAQRSLLLERLLAFREAARQLREAGLPPAGAGRDHVG